MTTPATEPAGNPQGPGGLVGVAQPGVTRLRLDVAYDGAGFHGWARQPGLRCVQGELESALGAALRVERPVRAAVAGRTDAGVHAVGQVCHADVPTPAWLAAEPVAVRRRLNGVLPGDVRVRHVAAAPHGFHARWSAQWRAYDYLVADDPADRDPRTRGHVLWHPRALDVAAMAAAAGALRGEHDFAAYCRARPGASTVRTILAIDAARITGSGGAAGSPGPARVSVRADAFCHSMVRSIVGALLAVGEGRCDIARPGELLAAGVREPGIVTAPAHGLTLVAVGYPPDAELAEQAHRARRWRGR